MNGIDPSFNPPSGRPAIPSPGEPGTFGEQFAAIGLSLYLGRRRRTSAAAEWQDARRLVMPHARTEDGRDEV